MQRHFLRATGITYSTWRQIERARHAANLLREGVSILDTAYRAGYFDQSHLTRSVKQRIGQTPTEIIQGHQELSLLYKTETLLEIMMHFDSALQSNKQENPRIWAESSSLNSYRWTE
jgi:AraC-like DNA-binding protein